MQENEFEKALQQKMEALQVQPTGEVWEKVKAQVAQKKRKRRFAFLFVTAGILLAGLFIAESSGLFNNKQKITIANRVTMAVPVAKQQGANLKNTKDENTVAAIPLQKQTVRTDSEEQNRSIQNSRPLTKATPINHKEANNLPLAVTNTANETTRRTIAKRKTKANTKAIVINSQPVTDDEIETVAVVIPQPSQSDRDIPATRDNAKADINKNDTAVAEVATAKKQELKEPEAGNSKATEKQEKKTKKQKWGIGLSFSGGLSSAAYNNMDKSNAYADFLGATPGSAPASNGNTYYPSDAKKAFGFNAGIEVYRYLSDKIKLTRGLQYQLFSTSQKTGQQGGLQAFSDTRVAYGNTNTYSNKYHYLTLPVGIAATIFTIGNKEVSAGAGINFSRLIKTNALAFDTTNGNYYQNQSVFNKTFIGLSASVSINLAAKDKPAFYVGPQFYYSITPLANAGMYTGTHTGFIGLKLQKNLTK